MQNKRESSKSLLRISVLSLLIHGGGFLAYYTLWQTEDNLREQQQSTVKVTLQNNPPPPQKTAQEPPPVVEKTLDKKEEMEEMHSPTHNAEEFASTNQTNKEQNQITAGGGDGLPEKQIKKSENNAKENSPEEGSIADTADKPAPEAHKPNDTATQKQLVTTTSSEGRVASSNNEQLASSNEAKGSSRWFEIDDQPTEEELQIPRELLETYGTAKLLSDAELSETIVEDPFSEKRSKELKLVNRYLERMTKQVHAYWINPYKGGKKIDGVIKLQLTIDGHLKSSYIFRSSGDRLLDISVLDAIRAVSRYDVPDNPVIVERYYTNLSFFYSSIKEETELMPFEEGYADYRTTN